MSDLQNLKDASVKRSNESTHLDNLTPNNLKRWKDDSWSIIFSTSGVRMGINGNGEYEVRHEPSGVEGKCFTDEHQAILFYKNILDNI